MDYSQLVNFQAAAKHNNLTVAAKELHISQPALSQSIRKLEKELGVQLFHRIGKKIELNQIGEEILYQANYAIKAFQNIYSCANMYNKTNTSITIAIQAASPVVFSIVNEYYSLNEELPIHIFLHRTQSKGELLPDIIVDTSVHPYTHSNGKSILKENLVAILPLQHHLADQSSVDLADLARETFISTDNSYMYSDILAYWFEQVGEKLKISLQCDDANAVRRFIEQGNGISIVPENTWKLTDNSQYVIKPITHPNCYRYINVHIENPMPSQTVKALYNYIIQALEHY